MSPFVRQVGDSCYRHPFDMLSVLHKYTIGPNAAKDNTYRDLSYSDCHNFCSCICFADNPVRKIKSNTLKVTFVAAFVLPLRNIQ